MHGHGAIRETIRSVYLANIILTVLFIMNIIVTTEGDLSQPSIHP